MYRVTYFFSYTITKMPQKNKWLEFSPLVRIFPTIFNKYVNHRDVGCLNSGLCMPKTFLMPKKDLRS